MNILYTSSQGVKSFVYALIISLTLNLNLFNTCIFKKNNLYYVIVEVQPNNSNSVVHTAGRNGH